MMHIKDKDISLKNRTAITIGNFDGLHIGHQRLLAGVKKYSKLQGVESVVFSFYPHPASILRGGYKNDSSKPEGFKTILTSEEKVYLLEKTDTDIFIEYPFDESVAVMEPEDFIKNVFVRDLKCDAVVIGEGYKFGKERSGDVKLLTSLGEKYGFEVIIMPHLKDGSGQEKVSSAEIREFIKRHDFDSAERLMSRPYFVLGEVVHGKQIGNKIGIPTANVLPGLDKLLPKDGVYISKTHIRGKVHKSVTNVGTNPTLGEGKRTVETHILDFDEMIYGETIRVDFYKWLRDERKLSSLKELSEQIKIDIEKARY